MGPAMMVALVLTVMGMLFFFGSQGLPDPSARRFTSHPMFRPVTSRPRVLPAGASSRLDAAALDAFVEMEGMGGGVQAYEGRPPGAGDRPPFNLRRWLSQRPW